MSYFFNLVAEYGYVLIYGLLCIELMGVPFLPGEMLIVYCGFLVYRGKLNFYLVVLCAAFGVLTGMSLSYFIGRKLGKPFFYKYGKRIHLSNEKVDKFSELLNKYGTFLIMVICFIPGIKHVIGYLSGISDMKYKKYSLGSFFGAIIWAVIFTLIGKILGDKWGYFHKYIDKYLIVLAIFIIISVVIIYLIKIYKEKIINFVKRGAILSVDIVHSLGNLRIIVVIAAVIGVLLVDGFVNIVQGLLSNEFEPFNIITYYLVNTIFGSSNIFRLIFLVVEYLTRSYMYIVGLILIIGFIAYKGKNKKLEIQYAIVTLIGGGILEYILVYIFHLISSNISLFNNLINKKTYIAILLYGFLGYIVIKNIKKKWLKRCIVAIFILICMITGLAEIYYGKSLSQVLTGYSLGGTWLIVNIVLLEITRVMPIAKKRRKVLNLKKIRRK